MTKCTLNSLTRPVDLPDSFFQLTSVELKYLISGSESRRNQSDNAPLKTRAIREREEAVKAQKYPKTCIRIRFPDRYTLQLNFLTAETGKYINILKKNSLCIV